MADKRISQLIERVDIANNDVLPIVASGATTTNKVTISTIQDWMQENLDVGVTSVGITLGSSGTDVNVSGSPITTSGNITINIPTASATNRGLLSSADWSTFNGKQNSITLTTLGTSGAATLVGSTLNIPNYSTGVANAYVPYVGAIGSVTLGYNSLSASQINIDGASPTGGSYLGFKHSNSVNTGTDGYTSMYTFGTNTIAFKSVTGANSKDFSFSMVGITPNVAGGRVYTLPDASGTLALTSDLSGYVTLDTAQTITGSKTFNSRIIGQDATLTSSGSADTLEVTHSSGSGIAVDISKGGNGEGLRVAKTSGSGNAVTITGGLLSAEAATLSGALNGTTANFSGNGTFSGDLLSNTRVAASTGSHSIIITPNVGSTNRIEAIGSLPLALVSAQSITLSAGGTTPQITLASSGAVTLTGALNGTSASFSGIVGANGASEDGWALKSNGNLKVENSNGTTVFQIVDTSTGGKAWSLISAGAGNSHSIAAGTFYLRNSSDGSTALQIASTGAATFSGALNGTSASFTGNVTATKGTFNGTTSEPIRIERFVSGSAVGRYSLAISGAGNFSVYDAIADSDRLIIAQSTGAATFSSSVTANKLISAADANSGSIEFGTSSLKGILSYSAATGLYLFNNQTATAGTTVPYYQFQADSSPIMTMLKNGNLGIGTSTPSNILSIRQSNTSTATVLELTNTSTGSNTTKASRLLFGLTDTAGDVKNAAYVQATPDGVNVLDAHLSFGTRLSDTAPSERMRITSGGFLKASNTGNYQGSTQTYHELRTDRSNENIAIFQNTSSSPYGPYINFPFASPNNTTNYFLLCGDSTVNKFVVYSNGNVANTNNSYGAISDIKLKENIEDASPKLDDLMKVKVRNYNLIGDDKKQIGVIAQELEEVFPAMIDESEDFEEVEVPQVDEEGNEVLNEEGEVVTEKQRVSKGTTTKSVKYSVFVPMLIKAIQEQQEQIKSLTEQVEALKSQING